ncbi:amino acid ABC transporter permease [Streptomyces afghaniensis]|uniref:amino acid ABC transporter permease n=1 Tax=Streptomyces afghaniensis TaxID=66865 RepID=UPI0027852E0F|nr:amino acid ABC transporter permease [Streptomyces afghaniensis]MDQ1015024.1 polar amino acid transport system permease protein [Streptomyces afghaniensis]
MSGLFEVPWSDYRPDLVSALGRTVSYTVAGFSGAVLLGLAVALLRLSRAWPARALAAVYTEVFKNVPLLAIIFLTYFGLASAGIRLDVFTAGCLSLIVFYAAYLSEIFRAAISGVHAGQTEAGEALGIGRTGIFGHIVLPQALRLALPGTNTMLVDLLKSTSLLVTVSAAELMSEGRLITSATFRALEVYLVIAAIYFALCYPLSQLLLLLERKVRSGVPLSPWRRRRLRAARALLAAEPAAAVAVKEVSA